MSRRIDMDEEEITNPRAQMIVAAVNNRIGYLDERFVSNARMQTTLGTLIAGMLACGMGLAGWVVHAASVIAKETKVELGARLDKYEAKQEEMVRMMITGQVHIHPRDRDLPVGQDVVEPARASNQGGGGK